jgi:CDP-glucose 4,6-dehydratase
MPPGARFEDATVLVTGAQGFIGSWLAERLLDLGARVVVPWRDLHPGTRFHTEGIADRCHLERADVRDYNALVRILAEHEVTAVFHLAAQPIVGIANRSPLSTYDSNVTGAYTLLEACRARGVVADPIERIVVASSDHAYGPHADAPFREDFPMKPSYPYDVSKACADMIARCYAATYEMPIAVTRLANVYGGGDRNWSRIVPDTARSVARGERPVIRSDGTPERDYLYVEDAVDAYLTVADSLDSPDYHGRAWNAGLPSPVSVLELVRRLIAVSGKDVEPEIRGRGTPHAEADRLHIDSTAIREQLGWSPRWSLEEGLAKAYAWYERHVTERDAAVSGATVA